MCSFKHLYFDDKGYVVQLMPVRASRYASVLPTPSNSVHSILTQAELSQLHTMLQEVDTEIRTRQLMCLFSE